MKNFRLSTLILACFLTSRAFSQQPVAQASGSVIRPEEQIAKTTEGPNNVAFGNADRLTKDREKPEQTKGLQFKNVILVPALEYRWLNDSSQGGFSGNEVGASVGMDADVWNGLILGVLYGHTYRETENSLDISQHLESDAVTLYGAKRFFNLLNVGLGYNYANTRDRLTRAIEYNMDRESNGGTVFAGLSDRKGKWNWASTTSYVYVFDDYDFGAVKDRQTSRFGWANSLGYDVTKMFTLGASVAYFNFVQQDTYNEVPARDNEYWLLGPRFTFYPSDRLTVTFDFDSQQGYKDLTAYIFHAGVEIGF